MSNCRNCKNKSFCLAEDTKLPVRDDVKKVTYHRQPTKGEINFGYGAIHYRDFPINECCHKGTKILKKWFVAKDDGLRYYR